MLKKHRYLLTSKVQGSFYHIIRAYSWTFRLHVENEKPWLEYLQNGGRVLLCGWHQMFFAAIRHFKTYAAYHPALMISQSKDGKQRMKSVPLEYVEELKIKTKT